MLIALITVGVIVLAVAIFFITTTVKKQKSLPDKNVLTELESLRNKDLITEQEYNEKRAEIKARKGGKK